MDDRHCPARVPHPLSHVPRRWGVAWSFTGSRTLLGLVVGHDQTTDEDQHVRETPKTRAAFFMCNFSIRCATLGFMDANDGGVKVP